MDKNDLLEKVLDKLIKDMEDVETSNEPGTLQFFNLLKHHFIELSRVTDTNKSVARQAESIQSLTTIALLLKYMITYALDPFNGNTPDIIELIKTLREDERKKIADKHNKKVIDLFELGKKITEMVNPANDLPFNEKYNGEHKVFNDYIDGFSLKLAPFSQANDNSHVRLIAGVMIYMTDAIRLAVYSTFENKTITNPSHYYINYMTEMFAKEQLRRQQSK